MRAKLCVVEGQATKSEIVLNSFPVKIGRSRNADLPIAHSQISREHCELYELDGAIVVRDNGSANGTFINGEPIFEEVLKPGDRLSVGPLTFVAVYQHDGEFPKLHADDEIDELQVLDDISNSQDESESVFEDEEDDIWADEVSGKESSVLELSLDDLTEQSSINNYEDSYEEQDEVEQDFDAELLFGLDDDNEEKTEHTDSLPDFDSQVTRGDEDEDWAGAYEDVEGFPIRLQMTDAGKVEIGTAVHVAGIEVGYVYNLTWAQAGEELRAEALLIVQENLGSVLRQDVRIEIHSLHQEPIVVIRSPGASKRLLSPDQVVLAHDQTPSEALHSVTTMTEEDLEDSRKSSTPPRPQRGGTPPRPRKRRSS